MRSGAVRGASSYPASTSIPSGVDRTELRLGMPGAARAFAPNAGVIGILKYILIWFSLYTAYL